MAGGDVSAVVLLDKPQGLSSNQALTRVKRLLRTRKAGHTGALDPLATGMLPCCLGEATKIAGILLGSRKAYRARVRLGEATSTDDAEGPVVERVPVPHFDDAALAAALVPFRGTILQRPPMYAAIKRDGQPLYRLARQGIQLDLPPREVVVESLAARRVDADTLELDVVCGAGTYIRSLGRDLARALGTCGHLVALRRTWVEPYTDRPMVTLDQLAAAVEAGGEALAAVLLPIADALPHWPRRVVDEAEVARIRRGQSIAEAASGPSGACLLVDGAGVAIALAERDDSGALAPRRVFAC
jgi:tRNA pseudouridine55 synthase